MTNNTLKNPYVIVLGNEKGGTGKSTLSMHVITYLLKQNYKVASIDVDARQGTLTRYVENRKNRIETHKENLLIPEHRPIFRSTLENVREAEEAEKESINTAMQDFSDYDYVVFDTPGSDMHLSRFAHSFADTLITPLNDSFIDLDMLVRLKSDSLDIIKPSTYSEMVWEQKKQKAIRSRGSIDWIVVRNRLSSLNSKNKQEIERVLTSLSRRIGYRLASGFGERVIFRELFLNGITLLDLAETRTDISLSHIAAKQELTTLMDMIQLPNTNQKSA
jgi:chromosome partitioning protein